MAVDKSQHAAQRGQKVKWPELYRRFFDDTFSIFTEGKDRALQFLKCLNQLHPSLEFTMEGEVDKRLPFLDALMMRV